MKQRESGKTVDHPHVAGIAIGQHRFAAVGVNHLGQSSAQIVPGLAPADLLEVRRPFGPDPDQRMQQAIGSMEPGRITSHLAADDSPGVGMIGVPLKRDDSSVFDGGDHPAGIRTIQRTDGFPVFFHWLSGLRCSTFWGSNGRVLGAQIVARGLVLDNFWETAELFVETVVRPVVVDV